MTGRKKELEMRKEKDREEETEPINRTSRNHEAFKYFRCGFRKF